MHGLQPVPAARRQGSSRVLVKHCSQCVTRYCRANGGLFSAVCVAFSPLTNVQPNPLIAISACQQNFKMFFEGAEGNKRLQDLFLKLRNPQLN